MPERDLDLLIDAARACGVIAMGHFRRGPKVWDKPGQGPVTEADIAVNDMLIDRLRGARPAYGWLSEETPDTDERLDCDHLFLIDPIDGTSAFIAGDTSFSHSLAIAHKGVVTAAVVYLPAQDRLYAARVDGPATCNGQPIACSPRAAIDGATLLTPKANLAPELWLGEVPPVSATFAPRLRTGCVWWPRGRSTGCCRCVRRGSGTLPLGR